MVEVERDLEGAIGSYLSSSEEMLCGVIGGSVEMVDAAEERRDPLEMLLGGLV